MSFILNWLILKKSLSTTKISFAAKLFIATATIRLRATSFAIWVCRLVFLDKYNPDQFEILGATQRGCHDEIPDTKKYDDYWEVRQNGKKTGSSGGKTNENANLVGNDGKKNYFVNNGGRIIQSAYKKIFIRHKKIKK